MNIYLRETAVKSVCVCEKERETRSKKVLLTEGEASKKKNVCIRRTSSASAEVCQSEVKGFYG